MQDADTPNRRLTEAEIETFWTDGVLFLKDFYSTKWVDVLRRGLNEVCGIDEDGAQPEKPVFRSDAYTWHANDHLRDFSLFSPTAEIVQQVLRSDRVNFFCDQVFVKQAYNAERTPWHHDFTFFPLAGNQIASVWTSVDPVRSDESALEFVLGSHLWPQRFRPLGVGGVVKSVAQMEETPDFSAPGADYRIASWDMQPGDAVIFHALTLHGSQGRPAGRLNRRAIATRWCGDDARYAPTGKELQVAWDHGLAPGDPIGGPVFPELRPRIDEAALAQRMKGPVMPRPEIVAANKALAERFEKVRV
ncbi:MAG: phytanoyl-CoA dioxygenase family protein [Rhodobacteraceae bacterium]|nr:phytanoyl-CoA dioxygenase family protein [Paracoccaceae bacterium]MBR9823898.1 phytanoyl-CoA dioxygenase family protein [Paracoccaceae bacterium]